MAGFSGLKRLTYENVKKEKYRSGVYKIYDCHKKCIYVGVSHRIRHRLEAHLYARSDYRQVRGKMKLHKESYYYSVCYCSINTAREKEHSLKRNCKFNKL
jgi:predicted GIY-YIG superfamily endonuclease